MYWPWAHTTLLTAQANIYDQEPVGNSLSTVGSPHQDSKYHSREEHYMNFKPSGIDSLVPSSHLQDHLLSFVYPASGNSVLGRLWTEHQAETIFVEQLFFSNRKGSSHLLILAWGNLSLIGLVTAATALSSVTRICRYRHGEIKKVKEFLPLFYLFWYTMVFSGFDLLFLSGGGGSCTFPPLHIISKPDHPSLCKAEEDNFHTALLLRTCSHPIYESGRSTLLPIHSFLTENYILQPEKQWLVRKTFDGEGNTHLCQSKY